MADEFYKIFNAMLLRKGLYVVRKDQIFSASYSSVEYS